MKIKRLAVLPVAALAFGVTAAQFSDASAIEDASWGPQDRDTFTWNSPADHVTFNSITDNPVLGDERNFVRVREVGVEAEVDEIELTPGKEYQISIYYHNDASASLNSSGAGISRNTYVRTEFPKYLNANEIGVASASITASNAKPARVWDSTYLKASSPVYLNFVPNSAVIHNNGTTDGTILSGDDLLGEQGVTIGHYDNMWGMIPGCNEYGGYVTYRIKADAPAFTVDKKVASAQAPENFVDEIIVAPGDTLNFRINYKNTGTLEQTGVTAHDLLPEGLTYVEGSTYAGSTRFAPDQWMSSLVGGNWLFKTWVNTGSTLTAGNILYQSKDNMPAGTYTITAIVHTDYNGIRLFANNDTKVVTASSAWGTAYEVSVSTTLTEPGTLTFGLTLPTAPTSTNEINLYADNFTVKQAITTEIRSLTPNPSPKGEGSDYWYTLDGRKVSNGQLSKGIYINNGKKIVVK